MNNVKKGSQLHIQKYINHYSNILDKSIFLNSPSLLSFVKDSLVIEWKSPLIDCDFKEYQDDFLTLYFDKESDRRSAINQIRQFWPKKGPVWDGIGIVKGKEQKGLVLVEAKAHVRETHSKIKATSDISILKIKESVELTQKEFGCNSSTDAWLNKFYQLSNRLAYLRILNDELKIPTWLVLINFVEDKSHKKTTEEEWLTHYQSVFQRLDIHHDSKLLSKVNIVFVPAIDEINEGESVQHC